MALPTLRVAEALKATALQIEQDPHYSWAYQGACNCGHLAQCLTQLSRAEIHAFALQKAGDWNEHIIEYCPASGYPIDHIITTILDAGFSRSDIAHLERLSDTQVLNLLPPEKRNLKHNRKEDVILYLQTWIQLIESQTGKIDSNNADTRQIPEFGTKQEFAFMECNVY